MSEHVLNMCSGWATRRPIGLRHAALPYVVPHVGTTPGRTGMLAYMKRTTVKLPDALDARLRHEAELRGTTIADISREALEAYLGGPSERRRLGAAAAGRSGRSDVSERIEEILAAEVGR